MNPSAYAVWRALVKYDLRAMKNSFFKLHIVVRIGIILYGAIFILIFASAVVVPQFVQNRAPLDPDKAAEAMEQIVMSSAGAFLMALFFSFLSGGMGMIRSTDIPMIAPLAVHKGALYFHRVARVFFPFLAIYLLFVPGARLAGVQLQAGLLQDAVYYLGWIGILAFCAGLTIGVSSLLSRLFGMERSDKAFKAVMFLLSAVVVLTFTFANMYWINDSVKDILDSGVNLYAALPSTWAALALKDPFPIWQLASLTALGAGGILFGYAAFVRTFNIEEAMALIEKKAESGKFQSKAGRYGALSAHIRKDWKLLLRNRKLLAALVFSLGAGAVWVAYSFFGDFHKSGAVINSFGLFAAFIVMMMLPAMEGRGVLSVRMTAPNMASYAASKALEVSALIFVYTLAAFGLKTKAVPMGMDILICALIGVGYGCFTAGVWCAFPRFDEKKPIGLPAILCFVPYCGAAAIAFGYSPESAYDVWIAAAVCVSGVFAANQGRKRLESMDALW